MRVVIVVVVVVVTVLVVLIGVVVSVVLLVMLWPVAISRGATNKHNKLIKFRKLRSLILFHFKLYTRFEHFSLVSLRGDIRFGVFYFYIVFFFWAECVICLAFTRIIRACCTTAT